MKLDHNFPIIIGVGQIVDHWTGEDSKAAPHPVRIIRKAIETALSDAGIEDQASRVDCAAFIRTFSDSLRRPFDPFGKVKNLPRAVIDRADLSPEKVIYSSVGGEQPQALVAEMSEKLHAGDIELAVIAGGEVTGALKTAMKKGVKLDWAMQTDGHIEDRGAQTDFISEYEIQNGLGLPPQTYAAMEQALRARLGMSKTDYLRYVGLMFSNMSKVAQDNPYAQFPAFRTPEFLAISSKENYPVFEPYLKWHMAQDAVNQAAALVLTTVGKARELGVPEDKWVYLHGYSKVEDNLVSQRPDLSKSDAIELAINRALEASGLLGKDITHRDIYSCFPIVLHLAAEYLELDPTKDQMSVTGGLPFFGGAGNNYSTHAIASLVETLRADKGTYGMMLANGGFMSKEAVGIYSAQAPKKWAPISSDDLQATINNRADIPLLNEDCTAATEGFCVKHGRHGVESGYVIARNETGRVIARVKDGHRATLEALVTTDDVVGQSIKFIHRDGRNFVQNPNTLGANMSDDFLSREFKYINLKRNGNVLEVTLNRPESYNALHSAAHFELAEIFDEFEADKDLWVAIITGTGEKAFCSGNDLKVTASGGDMSTPPSGFAGLCARTNREKPVIAAVNGVAMGGGLEIVLACDVALASANATFALPEVKVGLFAAAGGVQRLTRQIGEKAAMELILTGQKIDAEEAAKLGLINSIANGDVMTEARALAQTIAANSPTSIRASKRVLNAVENLGNWDKALELSKAEIAKLMQTKDMIEGVTAFAQKRKPNWVNG
ncbi:enoyl-CoA hydratase-related protein [Hellea sp.]|nr:enoyl-CoA hydratase-related protein [Hellea sp.]